MGESKEVKTRTPNKAEPATWKTQGREATAPRRRADGGGERTDHYHKEVKLNTTSNRLNPGKNQQQKQTQE